MIKILDIERFSALADAYGGNLSRWPVDLQEAAKKIAAQPEGQAILQQAARLDQVLDAWTVAYPSHALIVRAGLSVSQASVTATRRLRIWWAGIGLAAALSGAVVGSLGAASISPDDTFGYASTLFGDVSGQED